MKTTARIIICAALAICMASCSIFHTSRRFSLDQSVRTKIRIDKAEIVGSWQPDRTGSLMLSAELLKPKMSSMPIMRLFILNIPEETARACTEGDIIDMTLTGSIFDSVDRIGYANCQYPEIHWAVEPKAQK
jgi:hypothetical protein